MRTIYLFLVLLLGACTVGTEQPFDPDRCLTAADCVLAIRTDVCCSCPQPMTLTRVERTPHMEVYLPGRNYGALLPSRCALVDCALCQGLDAQVICAADACKFAGP